MPKHGERCGDFAGPLVIGAPRALRKRVGFRERGGLEHRHQPIRFGQAFEGQDERVRVGTVAG